MKLFLFYNYIFLYSKIMILVLLHSQKFGLNSLYFLVKKSNTNKNV